MLLLFSKVGQVIFLYVIVKLIKFRQCKLNSDASLLWSWQERIIKITKDQPNLFFLCLMLSWSTPVLKSLHPLKFLQTLYWDLGSPTINQDLSSDTHNSFIHFIYLFKRQILSYKRTSNDLVRCTFISQLHIILTISSCLAMAASRVCLSLRAASSLSQPQGSQ